MSAVSQPLLSVENLTVSFSTERGPVDAVRGVSLTVDAGETLCLVGESGCGKSVTCHALLGLLPANGRIAGGAIRFAGRDLARLSEREMENLRGREIAMIFQDPLTALNPVHSVGSQLAEALVLHRGLSWAAAKAEARRLLDRVRIPDAARRLKEYPHQLSGGMNQRVVIAMAMACRPKLIVADEPTTALDVTIQAQILDLLRELKAEEGMALLLVTHDLGVVAEMADRVAVMYLGRVAEEGEVRRIFAGPAHPYTRGLLRSIPRIDVNCARLATIEGSVPSLHAAPAGCAFAPRCENVSAACRQAMPEPRALSGGHRVACFAPAFVAA
ncbi:MAG: ABC transporter ATP-binding protein [Alphaproteobacteria bacterium]